MSLLIDSHALLWWLTDDRRLGDKARSRMTSSPRAMVSVAVAWELGIKEAKGRIRLPDAFDRRVIDAGFEWLPIDIDHVAALRDLPAHHADPFDRIMIAQARAEHLALVSADGAFARYEVDVVGAAR